MIGQVNTSLWIIVQRGQEFGQELSAYFDESGQGDAHNNNPMFIEQFSDGEYLVVYTDPPQDTRMQIFGLCDVNCPPQNPDTGPIIISQEVREFPRAVSITKNDEILIYTERLTNSTVPEGYLYRVDKMGNTKFRIRLEGTPGDVIESQDGTILVLSNPLFNGLIPKTRLTKLSADGTIF